MWPRLYFMVHWFCLLSWLFYEWRHTWDIVSMLHQNWPHNICRSVVTYICGLGFCLISWTISDRKTPYLGFRFHVTKRLINNMCRAMWHVFHVPVVLSFNLTQYDGWMSYLGICFHVTQRLTSYHILVCVTCILHANDFSEKIAQYKICLAGKLCCHAATSFTITLLLFWYLKSCPLIRVNIHCFFRGPRKKCCNKKKLEQMPRGLRIPPGRCHFLIIKYFKVNDNDIRQDIVYNVSLWVTLICHPKYNFPGVNSLQDMKQMCWAIKYRSLTYTYWRN